MNVLLLVPDGMGVRNFLQGEFLQRATAAHRVHVFHNLPADALHRCVAGADRAQWHRLIPYGESPLSFTLRHALAYAQMYWVDTLGMRHCRRLPPHGSLRTRSAHKLARLLGACAAGPRRMQVLDRVQRRAVSRLPAVAEYRRVFEDIGPSVLFCSHQRPPSILAPVLAARELGIPTATFIFSWDNLTLKGRIAAPFDHYLVWSDHMRQELLRYYPDVSTERAHVIGTPQFDCYADERLLWSRQEFCARIGADPARPLICYSGCDRMTGPEDPQHVRVLMELIRGGRIAGSPQVVLRPSPVDEGSRYADVRRDYPELIFAQPAWVHASSGDWSLVSPLPDDIDFLANLTHHADLNVNMASTMTLDFGIHDTPVVNIAFDVASPPPFGRPLWEFFYQFEHYRPVVELGAARVARSASELATHVNAYLEDPTLDGEGRRRLVALEVGAPLGQSSRRIVEVLTRIASARRDSPQRTRHALSREPRPGEAHRAEKAAIGQ